jgi:hypothetical protein
VFRVLVNSNKSANAGPVMIDGNEERYGNPALFRNRHVVHGLLVVIPGIAGNPDLIFVFPILKRLELKLTINN